MLLPRRVAIWTSTLLLPLSTYAADSIETIEVRGLQRTEKTIVLRELEYKAGQKVSEATIRQSVQNLRNLGLFASVKHHRRTREDGKVSSIIDLEEKWTTIPILKLNRGGGVSQIVVGAYDINLFGKFLEGGTQFERIGNGENAANSGVVWFRNPRFLGKRLHLGLDAWDSRRIRPQYQPKDNDEASQAFLHHRRKANLKLGRDFNHDLKVYVVFERIHDSFSDQYLSPIQKQNFSENELPEAHGVLVGTDFHFGSLNHNSFLVDGSNLILALRQCQAINDSNHRFLDLQATGRAYATLGRYSTIGTRAIIGQNNSESVANAFYLGGLDGVRGLRDSQFATNRYLVSNSEFRTPLSHSGWVVTQAIVFSDWARLSSMAHNNDNITAQSAGAGLRIMSPKVYRLVLRVDWAHGIAGPIDEPLSFGVQQFF